MTDRLSRDTFDHLVDLAAFKLEPAEADYIFRELNNQLTAIHDLEAIPLDPNIPITSHGIPYTPQITPPIRKDEWQRYERPEDILSQAPETDEGYIVVPEIPHTDLE